MTTKRSGVQRAPELMLAAVLVGGSLTGCAGEEQVAYCVDEDNVIVDEDNCDQESNGSSGLLFWYLTGPYSANQSPGTRLDGNMGTRINPSDSAARSKAGLPETGKVQTGKSGTYFKPGGFGSFKSGGFGS